MEFGLIRLTFGLGCLDFVVTARPIFGVELQAVCLPVVPLAALPVVHPAIWNTVQMQDIGVNVMRSEAMNFSIGNDLGVKLKSILPRKLPKLFDVVLRAMLRAVKFGVVIILCPGVAAGALFSKHFAPPYAA